MSVSGVEPEDDLDPLAPVVYEPAEPDPEPVDDTDGGVSDSENIVRIWVTDGRLQKVRVSPVWFQRLGRRSLADCFAQAFRMANARVAEAPAPEERHFDGFDFSTVPPFTNRAFAVMQDLFAEVEERWNDAIESYHARPKRTPVPTEGRSKGVTVLLNEAGLADQVVFDEKWLDSAQAGSICTHVQLAANHAYSKFVPAEDDRDELDAIEEEHQFLMATLKAMLDPKE